MDVPANRKVAEKTEHLSASLPVSTLQTTNAQIFNNEIAQVENSQADNQAKMRVCITIFILVLLLIILVYGLIVQNYWIIGIGCLPLVRRGVNKIIDRYL
jgi:uncharacterized ion transporter superfamily protein YfcC